MELKNKPGKFSTKKKKKQKNKKKCFFWGNEKIDKNKSFDQPEVL